MSKIIIDIPEEQFERIVYFDVVRLRNAVTSGLKLPENATNGDMINALFPNAKNTRVDGGYPLNYVIEGEWHRNLKEWWDTEYIQEVQEDVTE